MEAYGLGQRLDIPTDQAREILDAYFAGVPERRRRTWRRPCARRRRAATPPRSSAGAGSSPSCRPTTSASARWGSAWRRTRRCRARAADIFKLAMIDLDRALDAGGFASRMVLTVHDELVLEVPLDERDDGRARRARGDGARHRAARAARRRHRLRPQLGRREVATRRRAGQRRRHVVQPDRGVPRSTRTWAPGTTRVQAFTKGTEQEVDFLVDALALEPGMRVLDVGCGPGRHSLALARRGSTSSASTTVAEFVAPRPRGGRAPTASPRRFEELDVRELDVAGEFDAAICLCQGGFGLLGGGDETDVFGADRRDAAPRRSRSRSARSRPHFAVRHLEAGEDVRPGDRRAARGRDACVVPTATKRRSTSGPPASPPRELELLAARRRARRRSRSTASRRARTPRQAPTLDHHELCSSLGADRSANRLPTTFRKCGRDL